MITSDQDQPDIDIIVDISKRMTTILNLGLGLPELLAEIVENTATRFDLKGAAIYLYEAANDMLRLEALSAPDGGKGPLETVAQYRLADDAPVPKAASSGSTVISDSLPVSPTDGVEPTQQLAMPMSVMGELIGVLCVFTKAGPAFDEKTLRSLTTLAEQSATAIDNLRLFDVGRVAQHENALLYRISRAINATSQAAQILDAIVQETGPLDFNVHLYIYENYDLDTATYIQTIATIPAGSEDTVVDNAQYPIIPLERDQFGLSVCEDVEGDCAGGHETYFKGRGIQAIMNARMNLAQRTIGSISFTSPAPRTFSPIERRLISGLSDLAATAVERSRLYEEQIQIAKRLYEQKEQLSETLGELTHAKSVLEVTNQKLEVAQHEAEEASKAKSVFLSNMSHELRTPLNVVIGYSSTMLEMPTIYGNVPLPEQYEKDVHLIRENGYYLLGLINDILDLSKIEAGKLALHLTTVTLSQIVPGVLATCIGLVKDKPIQIRSDVEETMPPVLADPMRVRQIILNLMSNAIKFTHSGSVTLRAWQDEQCVHVAVIDTGIGIPENALAHVFDRFEQAQHDTDQHYGGTGLGLEISRRFARMHGGELTVESVVGKGSTFAFTLPISTEIAIEETDLSTSIAGSAKTLNPARNVGIQSILLIEDEASTRDLMQRTLEEAGYMVVNEQDGALALAIATGLLPDLIILDISLPNMNGWDLLETLKKTTDTASIPVLVCTVSEDEPRASQLGAASYLRKPFSPDVLVSQVQNLLPSST